MATTIVTLTRFPDIFARFAESVERYEPTRRAIVVTSGVATIIRPGWDVITGIDPFVFSRNANLGITAAGEDDVLLVNDDVELIEPIIDALSAVPAGIVTPQVIGDGINNELAQASRKLTSLWVKTRQYIPFVCVLLRRSMINRVGLMDERFVGYGGDDVEYCLRASEARFRMAVSRQRVIHGHGGHAYSSSFLRVMNTQEREHSMRDMNKVLNGV